MADEKKKGFGPWLPLTILIGFGFFTMGLMDPLYDTYLPVFLGQYIESNALIGTVMTLDNVFALFLIPVVSVWSDRIRTPIGRRKPFILTLLPLSAVFFGLLPYAAGVSLAALVILVFFLNLAKQAARGPVVALMPDTVPGEYRSEANGVINMMSGIASIVGLVGLARLMDVDVTLPLLGATKDRLPFPIASLLVALATVLVALLVKERSSAETAAEERPKLFESLRKVGEGKDKSAVLILVALFLWFLGYQGVLPFVGRYGIEVLGLSKGVAGLSAGAVGIAYALFAVPSGYVAHRLGRKRTIRIALVVLTLLAAALVVHGFTGFGLAGMARVYVFWAILFVFGAFWVTVVTNSFPMLWQMASWGTMGVYTGLYYLFSQTAAIASPPVTGGIIDLFGYPGIFAWCALCMAAAFVVMGFVKKGEPAAAATK